MSRTRTRCVAAAVGLVVAAGLAACGGNGDKGSPAPSSSNEPSSTSGPQTSPGGRLPWAPPRLSSKHRTVHVNNDPSTRDIKLKDGQDCLVVLPRQTLSDYDAVGSGDALVTVEGGRNVVVIGGHIGAQRGRVARLTQAVGEDDDTLTVDSTSGFPAQGVLRLDGEGIAYSSRDETHFNVSARRVGFFNDSPASSESSHAAGADVYLGENYRSGLSFMGQTGTVHVEGLLIDGFLNDGIRVSGGRSVLQVERTRIGPNTNYDLENETDGHPDDIQAYGGGASEIRLAQVTVLTGPNGNGLLNKASDSGDSQPVERWDLRDVEVVSPEGAARSLIANSDRSTEWDVSDGFLRYPPNQQSALSDPTLLSKFKVVRYAAGQRDIVPADSVGIGYRTLGYAK